MEKAVSSPKTFNIVVCILLLIVFAVFGTRTIVNADEIVNTNGEISLLTYDINN